MKIVENWKEGWRWISNLCMTAAAAIHGSWLMMPEDMKSSLDPKTISYISLALMVTGVVGRFIDQTPKRDV